MRRVVSLLTLLAVGSLCGLASGAPENEDSLLVARGDGYVAQFDYFHAMQQYEQVARPTCGVTRKLATCHFLRANYRQTVALLEPMAVDSLDHDALRQLYFSHKTLGNRTLQKRWGRRLLERYPMDSEVVADMAQELNLDTPEEALELTRRYEAVDPTNILVKRQTADALFFTKQYPEAAETYERLLALGDSTFSNHYSLGMSYEQLAEAEKPLPTDTLLLDKAIGHYGVAVTMNDSTKAWPLYHLGTALVRRNHNTEGIHVLLMALERMQPDDVVMFNLHNSLAEGYYQNGQYVAAIYDWKNCLKYNPKSLATLYNIAQTYEVKSQNPEDGEKSHIEYGDSVNAESAYVDFMRVAIWVKEPTPALQEWMAHAESYGAVKEKTERFRREMENLTRLYGRLKEENEKEKAD